MTRRLMMLAIGAALLAAGCRKTQEQAAQQAPPPDSLLHVVLETSLGRIVLELDRTRAPRTVANILRHLDVHFYDGMTWHRVVPGFVIQTGMETPDKMVRTSSAPPVVNEAQNGLRNLRGTVGLARFRDPHSGTVQFYVNLKDNPELDFTARTTAGFGYTVFGRVIEGMDVADRIGRVRTGTVRGVPETPLEPVLLNRAYVVPADSAPGSPTP